MREFVFDLAVSADEYLKIYRGEAKDILATSRDGLRVRFPASALQRWLTHEGIRGSFVVAVDKHNKLQSVRRLDGPGKPG